MNNLSIFAQALCGALPCGIVGRLPACARATIVNMVAVEIVKTRLAM